MTLLSTAAISLVGCTTTQQKAAWLQLNSARIRVSQEPLHLARSSSTVRVLSAVLVPGRRDTAIVVTLRNTGARPVSDLPLLVGARTRQGRRIYLNAGGGASYFDNHVPVIASRGVLRWVLSLSRPWRRAAVPFARVGGAGLPPARLPRELPMLRVMARRGHHGLVVTVANRSDIPQYQLTIYAIARRADRVLAAGRATVAELDGGTSTQLPVSFVGDPARTVWSLEVPPTIFK